MTSPCAGMQAYAKGAAHLFQTIITRAMHTGSVLCCITSRVAAIQGLAGGGMHCNVVFFNEGPHYQLL